MVGLNNINFMFIFILILISIYDFKYLIIPDFLLILLFVLAFIKNYYQGFNIENIYLGMSSYSFPLILLWILENHIEKELIGLGDIKLMIIIGMYRGIDSLIHLYFYYLLIYTLAMIISFVYILNKKRYIPFSPMICISTMFFILK